MEILEPTAAQLASELVGVSFEVHKRAFGANEIVIDGVRFVCEIPEPNINEPIPEARVIEVGEALRKFSRLLTVAGAVIREARH